MSSSKKKSTGKGKKGNGEIPSTALSFHGRVRGGSGFARNEHLVTQLLVNTNTLSSDAGGSMFPVFSSDPTSAHNWADYSAVYDEYRVLGIELRYFPNDRYDPGLTQKQRPMVVVCDHNGNAAVTTYAIAANYESAVIHSTGDPWSRSITMTGPGEALFTNTSSTAVDLYYIKAFATGLAISAEYGRYFIYYRVQFRGHGA